MNILITGGASGLGEAITKKLSQNGDDHVYFTFNKSENDAKKLENAFKNTTSIKCDFRNSADIKSLIKKIEEIDLDVLINNAYGGTFLKTHFHKITTGEFLKDFIENVMPVVEITQTAIGIFRKKKTGKIITILSSALIDHPPVGSAVYTANKAYLEKLTEVWAVENTKFNISSNSISPSFMQTNFTKDIDERMVEQIKENNPLKRLLTTGEVADAVLFFINAPQDVNGMNMVLNPGTNIK